MLEQQMGNHDAYALLVNREYHLYPESRLYIQRWFTDVMVTPQGVADPDTATDDGENNDPAPPAADDISAATSGQSATSKGDTRL